METGISFYDHPQKMTLSVSRVALLGLTRQTCGICNVGYHGIGLKVKIETS